MSTDFLSRASGLDTKTVRDQIRKAHEQLPAEKCMAWQHARRFPGKEGGCDIHPVEEA